MLALDELACGPEERMEETTRFRFTPWNTSRWLACEHFLRTEPEFIAHGEDPSGACFAAPERSGGDSMPAAHRTAERIPAGQRLRRPELKDVASRIKSKLEEFNVRGSVVQINPGPVVTTFEYKPEAGIKYSRITTLTEDLCLGLQAESVLIERMPGKPTVGIEVPNTGAKSSACAQILESERISRIAIAR